MPRRSPSPTQRPAAPVPAGPLPTFPRFGWPTAVVTAFAAAFPVMFLALAALRVRFPFELEWMEGSMIDHLERVRLGQPLYGPPSLEFTPFIYPPLYFWVSSAVAAVVGGGFLPLRLTSIVAAVACLALVYAIVASGTRRRLPAVLAACLFAACYREGGAWLDLGRVDTLSLALLLAGVWAARRGLTAPDGHAPEDAGPPADAAARNRRVTVASALAWGAAGGVCFALAGLTKQSALFVAAAAAVGLIVADRARGAAFLIAFGVVFGGATLALDAASPHWYRYYVFELPRHHPIIGQLLRGFWIQDLVGPVGLALAIGAFHFVAGRERARTLAFDACVIGSLILTGYVTRVRVGSFDNVVLPAYLGVALAFGLGLRALDAAGRRASPAAWTRGERFVALLCVAQFALLLYKPWQQLPRPGDAEAGRQIVESLRRVEGEVWIPSHPYLARMAGKPGHAHQLALTDVMRPGPSPEYDRIVDSLRAGLRDHRYAAVVLDGEGWFKEETQSHYVPRARMFSDTETDVFWPVTGFHTRPDLVWMPDTVARP